ncbi:MAG: hypothetical protein IPF59_08615 [Ignavibacteria bacterium]|nr:hypothetical protein [Ignavibacteria bacterium]MBK6420389.1 hypothetical protein [Ignavibacteria bacterium]
MAPLSSGFSIGALIAASVSCGTGEGVPPLAVSISKTLPLQGKIKAD